jgi:hypothetical protein
MNATQPIPYAGSHVGPRRLLALTLRRSWVGSSAVHVGIDGATYVLPWGSASFEVPADRPVHVSVYQQVSGTSGVATTVLPPQAPPQLEYRAPWVGSASGAIGSPGTVRARGRGCGCVLGVVAVVAMIVAVLLLLALLLT